MYILTNSNNVVIQIGNTLEIQSDRYIIDNVGVFKEYKTQNIDGTITIDTISSFEVEIPEGVEVEKYCYTEADGFTLNPNYVAPLPSNEERITTLEADSVQDETDINALEDAVLDILEQLAELGGSV